MTKFFSEVIHLNKLDSMPDLQYLFGSLFVATNQIDTIMERGLKKFDVTTKQWFLSIIIDNLFHEPPSIKEVAKEMGSSHQNVKQIALKMAQKGLLELEKDTQDARVTHLKLTKQSVELWNKVRKEGQIFTETLFQDIDHEELRVARSVMRKMLANISEMDRDE
ncbi:MarR family winged helix-turn-helix transcriptional regulator [Sporolactobacillus spathodeae]|uniref:DNA-binding MarR family transcriptional regulator n=1 Tax=Sporolactobacillus spathodeae TaxID=1465502 RepID=A0ABS2QA62_9BACL|nr:MarR family transcriptional regulator [Sporolactobacillus spathodeae]MBM7658059.1 DNA-binding MarR family transcriptional regulator [Sporolactobacillus spathodeae]